MEESAEIDIVATLLPLVGLVLIIALGVILMAHQFQRSLFRQRLAKENLKNEHQQELLRTAIEIQEKERKRIASDLHDELGARLSMSLMQLKQVGDPASANQEQLSHLVTQMEEHMETALEATKRISHELMPLQLVNLGLRKALLVLTDEARKAGNTKVSLLFPKELEELSWPAKLGLYRMLSELLNNTLKHAEASEIHISLEVMAETVHCEYQDNGKGLPSHIEHQGLGLQSLEARANSLNGFFEAGNADSGGFHAKITVPFLPKVL